MNHLTINLSSLSSNYVEYMDQIVLDDHTLLKLNVSNISETILPIYMKIDWGDGTSEIFDNNIYNINRFNTNISKISPLLISTYEHEYHPSSTSLYKELSSQFLINYANGDYNWFILPIRIRTYDFFESIYDTKILNTSIVVSDSVSKTHRILTTGKGFVVELNGG